MDGADIWECICKHLGWKDILKYCVLSKRHNTVGKRIIKELAFIVNPSNLRQLIDWVYTNVSVKNMKAMKTSILDDDADEDENEEDRNMVYYKDPPSQIPESNIVIDRQYALTDFYNLKSAYNYTYNVSDDNGIRCVDDPGEDDRPVKRLIPMDINLDTLILVEYMLIIENTDGINTDTRGTKHPKIEFGDFYDKWIWRSGFMTVKDIVEGCFRLKSHKFDNWYEMTHGLIGEIQLVKIVPMGDYSRFEPLYYYKARLSVDHGS